MPDFTNLDPNLIASFWIYFVGSFIVGAVIGVVVAKIFFHRQKDLLDQERQGYLDKIKILEDKEKELETKSKELEQLKSELAKSELYWSTKKREKQNPRGDKVLFDVMHNIDSEK